MTDFPFHKHRPPAEDNDKWCPHCGGPLTARPMVRHPCFDDDHERIVTTDAEIGRQRFISVTFSQWEILRALRRAWQPHRNNGRVQSRTYLLSCLPADREPDIKIINVQICKLRPKLVGTPFAIKTARDRGYYLTLRGK